MKARLPISNKMKSQVRQEVAKEYERQGQAFARRMFKLMCVSLNEEFGFGKDRLNRLMKKINDLSAEHENDEVYWTHIDRVMQELGVEFIAENYEEVDR